MNLKQSYLLPHKISHGIIRKAPSICSGNQELGMDSWNGNGGMFQGINNSKNHTPKRDDEHSRVIHTRVPPPPPSPLPLENTKGQVELDCSRLFEFPLTKFSRDNRFPLHFFLPFLLFSLGFIAFDLCAFSISEKKKCCGLDFNCSGRRLCVDRMLISGHCLVGVVNFLFRRYLQLISPCLVTYIINFTYLFLD